MLYCKQLRINLFPFLCLFSLPSEKDELIKHVREDYLFDNKVRDISTAFRIYVGKISTKYLGRKYTINDFSQIKVQDIIPKDFVTMYK